jgi:hypothetical protein
MDRSLLFKHNAKPKQQLSTSFSPAQHKSSIIPSLIVELVPTFSHLTTHNPMPITSPPPTAKSATSSSASAAQNYPDSSAARPHHHHCSSSRPPRQRYRTNRPRTAHPRDIWLPRQHCRFGCWGTQGRKCDRSRCVRRTRLSQAMVQGPTYVPAEAGAQAQAQLEQEVPGVRLTRAELDL